MFNCINDFVGVQNGKAKWSKQETCFARATHVWLAVNHNISVKSGE